MGQNRNLFAEKNEEELSVLYLQYCGWSKTGVISEDFVELCDARDKYVELYDVHGLHIMELDLLKAIAQRWFSVVK